MSVSQAPPIVTLTTDFGLADHYAGSMKGVILSRCSEARLVDISHEIPPFSIYSAAYTIDQAAPFFPPGTVHVVVVDPGVGTARRGLCAEALGQIFVAPDNGVLSLVAQRDGKMRARELTNRDLWLPWISPTFHGRDIFAPTAAALASGAARVEDVGPIVSRVEELTDLRPRQMEPGFWVGRILSVDRFGNAITNLKTSDFAQIAWEEFAIEIGEHRVDAFSRTFGDAARDVCFAFFGSSGHIELGMNQQSAGGRLGISAGDAMTLRVLPRAVEAEATMAEEG
jgi:S-adenosyl-L-methionine hydrolase (adenosine-forming)